MYKSTEEAQAATISRLNADKEELYKQIIKLENKIEKLKLIINEDITPPLDPLIQEGGNFKEDRIFLK